MSKEVTSSPTPQRRAHLRKTSDSVDESGNTDKLHQPATTSASNKLTNNSVQQLYVYKQSLIVSEWKLL